MCSKLCDIKYEKIYKLTGIWEWKQTFKEMIESQLSARRCQIARNLIFNIIFDFHSLLKRKKKSKNVPKNLMAFQNIKTILDTVNKSSKIYLILHASSENFTTARSLMYNHITELYIEPLGKQIYILLTIQLYNCEQHG